MAVCDCVVFVCDGVETGSDCVVTICNGVVASPQCCDRCADRDAATDELLNVLQLLRKRYIGNDIVTIVFQEPGALPFTPKHIRSQFQHVFIVVQAVEPCSERARYRYVAATWWGGRRKEGDI